MRRSASAPRCGPSLSACPTRSGRSVLTSPTCARHYESTTYDLPPPPPPGGRAAWLVVIGCLVHGLGFQKELDASDKCHIPAPDKAVVEALRDIIESHDPKAFKVVQWQGTCGRCVFRSARRAPEPSGGKS